MHKLSSFVLTIVLTNSAVAFALYIYSPLQLETRL
jgi:hypothetical protein